MVVASASRGNCALLEGINGFQKREAVEVSIACDDAENAMLAHKHRRVRIVEQIAREMRDLRDNLRGNLFVARRWDQDAQAWTNQQRSYEGARLGCIPRPPHDPRVSRYAQELIEDPPGGISGVHSPSLAVEPFVTGGVVGRVSVGSVHEHVRVYDEHYRSSITPYRASRSAMSTSVPPPWNVGRGGMCFRFGREPRNSRKAVSTSSDIVRL